MHSMDAGCSYLALPFSLAIEYLVTALQVSREAELTTVQADEYEVNPQRPEAQIRNPRTGGIALFTNAAGPSSGRYPKD